MSGRAVLAAAALAASALGLAGCGPGPVVDQPSLTFTVDGITLRVASAGVVRGAGEFTLWLTDAPDTCAAVAATPVQTTTFWSLRVAPPAGASTATVVPMKVSPAPGEATGRLEQRTGGVPGPGVDAASGSVSWTGATTGPITVDALDVGYAGTADRITAAGLVFRACN